MSDLSYSNRGRTRRSGRTPSGEPNPIDIFIGEQIRRRRQMLGMSQEQLAVTVGLTFQQIQKYERGINRISGSRIWDICQALKFEPNYLFMGMNEETANQSPRMLRYHGKQIEQVEVISEDPLYLPETLNLVKAYYRLKPGLRKSFYETMALASRFTSEE